MTGFIDTYLEANDKAIKALGNIPSLVKTGESTVGKQEVAVKAPKTPAKKRPVKAVELDMTPEAELAPLWVDPDVIAEEVPIR